MVQLIGVLTKAVADTDNAIIVTFNSYSPVTAQGVGLSSIVKTNGLARLVPTNSTADVLLTGNPGVNIQNGVVEDINGVQWALPTPVTIPPSTEITVTATCTQVGDFAAIPGSITKIATPTRGWISVSNTDSATEGNPVESDAALRMRQFASVALPAQSSVDSVIAAVANITGVQFIRGYENDTDNVDANGLPPHSISLVVDGGDAQAIGNAIALKKTIGAATYGTTSVTVIDAYGIQKTINFYRPTEVPLFITVNLTPFQGYTSNVGDDITAALVAYFAPFNIGKPSYLTKLYTPANLTGNEADTFDITSILQGTTSGGQAATDVPITFFQVPTLTAANVTVTPAV